MSVFKRGISQEFVEVLKSEYKRDGWWKKIVNDKDLFVAIRNEYINVYYQGNSLIKLSCTKGNLSAETHYKYLVKPQLKNKESCLIRTSDDMVFVSDSSKGAFDNYLTHNLSEIKSIKKASSAYGGVEKEGIQKILKSNNNIIDLEIALTKEAEYDEIHDDKKRRDTAKRIDFAAIQGIKDSYELIFFEAKDYSNTELRAEKEKSPPVQDQIQTYENLLSQHQQDIKRSYVMVCKNWVELLPTGTFHKSITDISNGADFKVNLRPRLVIFGFDNDQKYGKLFEKRMGKLVVFQEEKRLLLKGNPNDFTNGISFPK